VQDDHGGDVRARLDQDLGQMAANEPAGAGHQCFLSCKHAFEPIGLREPAKRSVWIRSPIGYRKNQLHNSGQPLPRNRRTTANGNTSCGYRKGRAIASARILAITGTVMAGSCSWASPYRSASPHSS